MKITRQSLLGLLALPNDERLCRAAGVTNTRETLRRARAMSATTPGAAPPTAICRHDPGYPPALSQLDCAPAVLHSTCDAQRLEEMLTAPTVALLGERHHTGYSQEVTFALASELARADVTVLSGLHQGIDGIAQHGALNGDGRRMIAVTGCAPEIPYPRQLDHLHSSIVARGAVLSEFPPGFAPPRPWCFLASQRIIAALADIVVIIEAKERSSTLFAAQIGADLGQDIAVVPGRVNDPRGAGTFALLRDGAHPVACARDVLELLPPRAATIAR
jgi:DNA processing protein